MPDKVNLETYAERVLRASRKERLAMMKKHAEEAPALIAKLYAFAQPELAKEVERHLAELNEQIALSTLQIQLIELGEALDAKDIPRREGEARRSN